MCFKGTPRRTWQQITNDFDNLGSTYNAYTSKERTVYFGWVRPEDFEAQLDLLADMMQSTIPPEEFEMEKNVILEEIAMSDDSLERKVYDLIHEKLYAGHPLAWPVLGTTESIGRLTRDELYGYYRDRYHPANMVLVVAGAIEPKDAIAVAQKLCGDWSPRAPRPARAKPAGVRPIVGKGVFERFQRQAIALIYPAPSARHPDRENADVLASILGGQNSRFFWKIVQAGIAPQVSAGRLDYCDDGLMLAYGFGDPPRAEQILDAMRAEIARLCRDGVTEDEVQRVKNRTRTALATEAEAPYYRLMQMLHDVDVLGAPRKVSERLAAVDAVTPNTIRDFLKAWPLTGEAALASLGPRDWPSTN
jgi:predicted Zn-dependent peptidase